MSLNYTTPDLTLNPPRSPRQRLGGYVILPRVLDKGRALIAGKSGDYKYNNPLDKRLFLFAGITAEGLLEQLTHGKSDSEILDWISEASTTKPALWDILQWSAHQDQRVPDSLEAKQRFATQLAALAPKRADTHTSFDLLDLDDYVTFGGRP